MCLASTDEVLYFSMCDVLKVMESWSTLVGQNSLCHCGRTQWFVNENKKSNKQQRQQQQQLQLQLQLQLQQQQQQQQPQPQPQPQQQSQDKTDL